MELNADKQNIMQEPEVGKSLKLIQLENQLLKTSNLLNEFRTNSSNHQLIRMAMQNQNYIKKEIEEEKSKQPKELQKLKPNPKTFRGKQRSKTSLVGNLQKIDRNNLDVPISEVKNILIETCSGTRRNRHYIKIEDLDKIKDYIDTLLLEPIFHPKQWHFKCPANLDGQGCNNSCNVLIFFERLRKIGYSEKVEEFISYVTSKIYEKEHQLIKQKKLEYSTIAQCPECDTYEWVTKISKRKPLTFENKFMAISNCITECICKHKYCTKCNKLHSNNTKCIFENFWNSYDEESKNNFTELIKDHKGQICPNCKHFWDKDEECDKVKCTLCDTKFCFTCGEDITDLGNNYLSHLISGPKIIGEEENSLDDIHFRCTKSYIRKACDYLNDKQEYKYLFEFVIKSLLCEKIFIECSKILTSDHPLDSVNDKSKIFLKICMITGSLNHKKFFIMEDTGLKFIECDGNRLPLIEGIDIMLDNDENSFEHAPNLMKEYFKDIKSYEGHKDFLNEIKEIIKEI